ncbi:hypothetical protein OH807_09435 [Kitasatospora sp. NBC_01560]|uniref:hypothetical protein n=1 Tax=Kitasatospora sp. NBC_01560 TaxID=2975965 RepID=UPI0038630610
MLTETANRDSRLSLWQRVREFAVPPSMIETATTRRSVGDWAGACAAAGFDVDLDLRTTARTYGQELASRVRADLRRLAPDLLRWHLPRIAPDGLLRPGLTITLARYATGSGDGLGRVHLVARTPPGWADGGQRVSLALWDAARATAGLRHHPHPHPSRRFRLDLHRHLWDAQRSADLRVRSGADLPPADTGPSDPATRPPDDPDGPDSPAGVRALLGPLLQHCAVDRWAAEAAILLRAEGRPDGPVVVRLGGRRRLLLDLAPERAGPPALRLAPASAGGDRATRRGHDGPGSGRGAPPPVLSDAATWVLPDLELVRTGSVDARRLHPLVAAALAPDHPPAGGPSPHPHPDADPAGQPGIVDCRGTRHRIGLVDGVLVPLDHDPAEIRREELLVALGGTPLPCLQVIDRAHRRPECLTGVRERLDHGDAAGALAVVEGLLGPDAVLRSGALQDELQAAADRLVAHGLLRAGLVSPGPAPARRPGTDRTRKRHATRR